MPYKTGRSHVYKPLCERSLILCKKPKPLFFPLVSLFIQKVINDKIIFVLDIKMETVATTGQRRMLIEWTVL